MAPSEHDTAQAPQSMQLEGFFIETFFFLFMIIKE
jgi:hypothetical protein